MFVTGFMFTGAMVFYLVRMYRMYKFFSLYEICLIQKNIATENLCLSSGNREKEPNILNSVLMTRINPSWPTSNTEFKASNEEYEYKSANFPTAVVTQSRDNFSLIRTS
jgi:hypothetical protein